MGAVESKVAFTQRFQQLWTVSDIKKDDSIWSTLWLPSESVHEVFSFVSPSDVRRVRDTHPENFETLLENMSERLVQFTRSAAVGGSVEPQIRQCLHIVARTFPVVYERPTIPGQDFWAPRFAWRDSNSAGPQIINAIIELLKLPGFAIPLGADSAEYIWAVGISQPTPPPAASGDMIENRIECLRALLAVICEPLFVPDAHGLNWLTCKGPAPPQNLLWSLINFALAHTPKIWNRPFEEGLILDTEAHLAALANELALLVIVHAPPGKNRFRRQLAKLNREEDLWFIVSRLSERIIAEEESLPFVALLWEAAQANRNFCDVVARAVAPILNEKLLELALREVGELSRVAAYTLLTLTSHPPYASQSASTILHQFFCGGAILREPALGDVLWNVAPFLDPGIRESRELALGISATTQVDIAEALTKSVCVILSKHPEHPHLARELAAARVKYPAKSPLWQPLTFEWDADRLRWYVGILWGCAYRTEQTRMGAGVWNGLNIELFRVDQSKARASLRRPHGLVDAVADSAASLTALAWSKVVSQMWS